jgi:hypothetical protein
MFKCKHSGIKKIHTILFQKYLSSVLYSIFNATPHKSITKKILAPDVLPRKRIFIGAKLLEEKQLKKQAMRERERERESIFRWYAILVHEYF